MNRLLGVSAGVPDLFVIVGGRLIGIEMKRKKGSVTSEYQKQWIAQLNSVGIETRVCKGCDEAISFIEEVIHAGKTI